jgi:hypothetical protein
MRNTSTPANIMSARPESLVCQPEIMGTKTKAATCEEDGFVRLAWELGSLGAL